MPQTQTPTLLWSEGDNIDYVPGSAVFGGDVVVLGGRVYVAPVDIAAGALGSLRARGVLKMPKDTSTFTIGDAVYWNATGNPVIGTAGTGAATSTAGGNTLVGTCVGQANVLTGDASVYVLWNAAKQTTTVAGSMTADDITGSDSSLGIAGLGASTGGAIALTGGASSGAAAGGAITVTGGQGGASQTGGAITIAGGVAASGNAAGGAATLRGGAGTGTGTGGLVTIAGGASAGASGTAGGVTIDAGAATGGTPGSVLIGDVNATMVYLARGALKQLQIGQTLTSLGTAQSSTPTSAQLLGGVLTQTSSTGAGTVTLPTGTALSAACPRTPAIGDSFLVMFANLGGGQTLTITGATGTTVRGTATVATATNKHLLFICTGSNAWDIYVTGG